MGLREEIQSEVAAAFDEDLADAVSDFSGSYVTHRHWDPVTETGGESTAIYIKAVTTIRGNYSECRSFRISLLYPVKESVNGKGMGYRTVNICRDD